MITILIGKSASWKTTLKEMLDKEFDFTEVENFTTRDARKWETWYEYLSRDEFMDKLAAWEMSENTFYNWNHYWFWLFKEDNNYLIIAEPLWAFQIMKWGFDNWELVNCIMLMRDDEARLESMWDDEDRKNRDDQYIDSLWLRLISASVSTSWDVETSFKQLKEIITKSHEVESDLIKKRNKKSK